MSKVAQWTLGPKEIFETACKACKDDFEHMMSASGMMYGGDVPEHNTYKGHAFTFPNSDTNKKLIEYLIEEGIGIDLDMYPIPVDGVAILVRDVIDAEIAGVTQGSIPSRILFAFNDVMNNAGYDVHYVYLDLSPRK